MTRVQLAVLLTCISTAGCDPVQPVNPTFPVAALAAPSQLVLSPSADTYLREWAPNQNQGTESSLRLQNAGNNRALLQWDAQAVAQSIGTGTLTGARIELTISDNGNNWGPKGRSIDLYRLNQPWSEGRATWNCAVDADLMNHRPDCSGATAWDMDHPAAGSFALTATASQTIRSGQTGTVAFDVTADVQAMVGGAGARFGWILKKTDESLNGRVEFGSRESGAPPRLVLIVAAAAGPQSLLTIADTGVTAAPDSQMGAYPKGTLLPYAFVAQPGFTNVQVQLDGSPVPASGSVRMDTTHVLMASADRVYTLVPGTEGLLASAQGLLTASDPVSAFQAHLNLVGEYVSATPPGTAEDALAAVYGLAFIESRDSAALDRLDDALGGHLFTLSWGGPTGASPILRAGAAPGDSAEPTVYIYVNGIWTELNHALSTEQRIVSIIRAQRELNTPRAQMSLFYNRTRSSQPLTPFQARGLCVYLAYEQLRSQSVLGYRMLLDRCMAGQHFSNEDDLVEAIRQWIAVHFRPTHFEEDAQRLADFITQFRQAGSHVILVPHSQGNLMAQQAMNILESRDTLFPDSTFLGAVALSSPSSEGWLLDDFHLLRVTLQGDLIPDAGLNSWPRLRSPLGDKRNGLLTLLNLDPSNALPALVGTFVKAYYGVLLHRVDASYLGQPEILRTIVNDIIQLYREATVGTVECAEPGQFFPGRSRNLASLVTVSNRNERTLNGRRIEWSSSDSSIARISATGQMTTITPGVTTITARSWQASCLMRVEVVPDLSGLWVGSWQRTSGGDPALGSVTLNLTQGAINLSGIAAYTYNGTSYGSTVVGRVTSPIGVTPVVLEISFLAKEYSIPVPDYTFSIQLNWTGFSLNGTGTVNYQGVPNGETRNWHLESLQQ